MTHDETESGIEKRVDAIFMRLDVTVPCCDEDDQNVLGPMKEVDYKMFVLEDVMKQIFGKDSALPFTVDNDFCCLHHYVLLIDHHITCARALAAEGTPPNTPH